MKKIFTILSFVFCALFVQSQTTGTGVVAQISSPYTFVPTTVDSTTTVSVQFNNTFAISTTVTFSGLGVPFSTSASSLTIPANDSAIVDLSFTPTLLANYSDTLEFVNSILPGTNIIVLNGEGVQVSIATSVDSLNLGTTPLGTSVTDSIMISNTGTGTMFISNISSNNTDFTVNPSTVSIAQGTNTYIRITYNPVFAGISTAVLSVASNDPNTPVYNIFVEGSAVSEISGSLCGVLSVVNSPYTLTTDITVADSCTLTIEPGVEIYGFGYGIYVNGTLNAIGTSTDSIRIIVDELSLENVTGHDTLNYISTYYQGTFIDDFEINNYNSNWSGNNSRMIRSTSYGQSSYGLSLSAVSNDEEYILKPFTCYDNTLNISWQYRNASSANYCYVKFNYRVNGGNWVELVSSGNTSTTWYDESFDISANINTGDIVEFMVKCDVYNANNGYNTQTVYIDNITFNKGLTSMIISNKEDVFLSNSNIISDGLILSGSQDRADFEDCQVPNDWSNYSYMQVSSSYANISNCGARVSAYNTDRDIYTPFYTCNSTTTPISFDIRRVKNESVCYTRVYYQINNNGSWTQIYYNSGTSLSWERITYNIPTSVGDSIRLQFKADIYTTGQSYNESEFYLDNLYIMNGYGKSNIINSAIKSNITCFQDLVIDGSTMTSNGQDLLRSYGNLNISNSFLNGKNQCDRGIYSDVGGREINLFNTTIRDFKSHGINTTANDVKINLQYSFIKDNLGSGILSQGSSSCDVSLNSSLVSNNGSYGISAICPVNASYSNITFNTQQGIYLSGNNFSNIQNSILWGNDISNYTQIHTSSGVTSITYSTVQGSGAYGTTGSQYYFGDGSIDDDPVFADAQQHMSSFSNCVDAGTPWNTDAYMPYGLGGVRSDIGIYGGPDNWFWGGNPIPDGSPLITVINDSPQDQGGMVGVLFDASVWDNSTLVNNVTYYSIWRNFDVNGVGIDSIQNGNWELMGNMPAQAFNSYAYSSPTLGDSNLVSGMFNSCFVIVAHTSDSSTFWYSNVLCGYSLDNLAPATPNAFAMQGSNGTEVIVYWDPPTAPDYSHSEVYSGQGFTSLGVIDTSTVDWSTIPGGNYNYAIIHFDVNGNPSDTAWVSITLNDYEDVIPLTAGWNLISTNKSPAINTMQDVFSSLIPGNLVYVTGFNMGSSLYNPNGLSFLNTLNQFTDGYGYWVKVNQDDTLRVTGTTIPSSYKIPLNANWNLSGYMNTTSQSPNQYLGDLISNNNLLYCTGFDQGIQLFNPNGLPFLNTLITMQRPAGYWIKVNNPVGLGQYRLDNSEGNLFSPEFMFVNGISNLESYVGEFVEVLNSSNELMAKMEIIEGGYLMTTALYGDDPSTDMFEGFDKDETLTFRFNGEEIISDIYFEGNMELHKIDLEFSNNTFFSIYPNPFTTSATIKYQLNTNSHVSIKIFDVTGRQIEELVNDNQFEGFYTAEWKPSYMEKGVYIIKLFINDTMLNSERVILQ